MTRLFWGGLGGWSAQVTPRYPSIPIPFWGQDVTAPRNWGHLSYLDKDGPRYMVMFSYLATFAFLVSCIVRYTEGLWQKYALKYVDVIYLLVLDDIVR